MIKAIIVDDEPKSCENLKFLVEEYCDHVEIIGVGHTISDSIKLIDALNPEIVFLDVQMQNETGFDLLEHYKDNITFAVIFTTAHSEYAIKAIRFSAVDYLLKPISVEELQEAINMVVKKINEKDNSNIKISTLLKNLNQNSPDNYKLALPTLNGLVFIKMNSIIFCEGKDNYTNIYTNDNKCYLVSKTLRKYEELLSDQNFYRIHKTYLVNLNEIKEYLKGEGGQVVMSNLKVLDVSRRKKEGLLKALSSGPS